MIYNSNQRLFLSQHATFHLGIHCLLKYLFICIQNEKVTKDCCTLANSSDPGETPPYAASYLGSLLCIYLPISRIKRGLGTST